MYVAYLTKLTGNKYKYEVRIFQKIGNELTPLKNIKFGASGYGDYTLGNTEAQKMSYIARHEPNEDWTESGYFTAGFWSRWILWNKRTVEESIKNVNRNFGNLKVVI